MLLRASFKSRTLTEGLNEQRGKKEKEEDPEAQAQEASGPHSSQAQEVTSTQDVAEAIGQIYYNAENYVESSKWLRIALANSVTKEDLFLKGLLASSILNCVKSNEKTLDGYPCYALSFQHTHQFLCIG